ncbi:hypothetical protein N9803_03250 [Gammaproteobacteria bacterium]|nr:hypothetical protein [Gammaproteobacteria bacterium]
MTISKKIQLAFCTLIFSLSTYSQVPASSAYALQEGQFFMADDLQDNLGMPSFLLCFMRQLAADQMAGPSAVTYLALVDEASCNTDSQVAQGAQAESKAAAASAKAGAASIAYKKVTVTVSQASGNDPMLVKAWVPVVDEVTSTLIYTYGSVTAPVSDSAPYGEFTFNYTQFVPGPDIDILKGQMSASGSQILWYEEFYDSDENDWLTSKATINLGSGTSGNGAVQYFGDVPEVAAYAYTADNFCRQVKLRDGSSVSEDEACFFTDEIKGKKEVFNYSLFNSSTGAPHDLAAGGFGIKFTSGGDVNYGFADFNGVHFDESTSKSLSDGQAFTVADPSSSRNGDTVTLDIISSSLRKITQSKVTLNSLDGVRINTFLDSNSDVTNLGTAGEYNMSYDSANNRFVATKRDGEVLALNFSVSEMLAASGGNKIWSVSGWVPGVGNVNISRDALASPSSSLVTKQTDERVLLADMPATLYCLQDCPGYTAIEAAKTKIAAEQSPESVYGGIGFGGSSSDFVTYTLNISSYNYADTNGDISMGSVSSDLYDELDSSSLAYGIYSGPLVTSKSSLTCPEGNGVDYCGIPIWEGEVTTYYQIETGHKPWHQSRRLLDASNNAISFTPPEILYFTAPDDSSQYGEFAGKEIMLEYNGGSDLWGIPGRCLNKTSGTFTDNCLVNPSDEDDGYWPWVDMFRIPKNESTGRLYTGTGQSGSYYLVAPNEGLVFLGLNASAKGTLTLGDISSLPSTAPTNIGPNGGANFIGAEPTQPSTPSVRAGVKITED